MLNRLSAINFALFGLAMWFFGNLYEGIVLAPNQLEDTIKKLRIWNEYFTVTNPIFYFVPLTHLAVITVWVLAFNSNFTNKVSRLLKTSAGLLLVAELVTVYIVVQLNLSLFFGETLSQDAIHKVRLWNVMNLVRLILVGAALWFTFQAYTKNIKCQATLTSI